MMNNKPVRTRFAPSPTGHMHLGSGRTALYAYLFARHRGGQFILRIEDTDQRRYVEGAEQELIEGMHWLGLDWDEGPDKGGPYGPYRQSERKQIYLDYAEELVKKGHAYHCFCTPERLAKVRQEQQKNKQAPHYDGTCRNISPAEVQKRIEAGEQYVIRFKTPQDGTTTVRDIIRGDIVVENRTIDDYVLVKSDGWALYHLAAMVDDHEMGITHVIRGSEWLPTFPLHAMIVRAFGWDEPEWVHLSVFLKPSGKGKMSKREASDLVKDGYSIFIKDLEGLGYLPEAVVNWIALMGWSYDDHTEFFTLQDLIEKFSLERLNPSPAAINFTKFDYFNGLHIRSLATVDLARRIKPFFEAKDLHPDDQLLEKIAPIIQERINTLDDAVNMAGFFCHDNVSPNPEDLVAKGLTSAQALEAAKASLMVVEKVSDFKTESIEAPMRELLDQLGMSAGQVFGIMRVAITGQKVSPPLFESMEIIGKAKVIQRMKTAVEMLGKLAIN